MSAVHELTRAQARQLAVRAQLLDRPRPTDLVETVRRLGAVQADQTAHVAPSAEIVLRSRLGDAFEPGDLDDALVSGELVELQGMLRPREDLPLFRAEMAVWPGTHELRDWEVTRVEWLEANRGCHLDVLERLRADGPLPLRELPDTCVVPWRSSGWNEGRNLDRLLNLLVERGEVALAGRDGNERLFDLAERVYPDEPPLPLDEARRRREERQLSALGLVRRSAVGEPAVVEGVKGRWRVDPALLGDGFAGRTAVLSPLDKLVFDRKRMADLFGFDYQLEMYKPAAARRWGYWAMPVLHGDRLVGKVDAAADREARVLRVEAVHEDVPFDPAMVDGVEEELQSLAAYLGLRLARG